MMPTDKSVKKMRLGERLIQEKLISQVQLEEALAEQKKSGKLLAEILVEKKFVDEKLLYKILAEGLEVEFNDLLNISVDAGLIKLIPEDIARTNYLVAIEKKGDDLVVAMAEPQNSFTIDELRSTTGCKIKPVLSTKKDIWNLIDKLYTGKTAAEAGLAVAFQQEFKEEVVEEEDIDKIKEVASDAPTVKFVDALITNSLRNRASDIHIEPTRQDFKVRFRIDGVLHDVTSSAKSLQKAVVSRIKIMANMDIAEKRLPQDGGFRIEVEKNQVDVRVSTYPTIYGEKVVMRLLTKEMSLLDLGQLGFESEELKIFESLIQRPCGILLVTGPTGSGKSTTLYAALNKINSRECNIITVEDPIEYKIDGISQSQVNPKAGFSFANSIRAMMRQDPDIIMVGEIRDMETAELAVRAALTGHLVLSTLHTNDAPSAITRLTDMGIEPYLVSASLIGVLAQRLVRAICPKCKKEVTAPGNFLESFKEELNRIPKDIKRVFFKGEGCEQCNKTGFYGRQGIYELMSVASEKMREAISAGEKLSVIRKLAIEEGMRTLKENGLRKVFKGVFTVEEVLRVTEIA